MERGRQVPARRRPVYWLSATSSSLGMTTIAPLAHRAQLREQRMRCQRLRGARPGADEHHVGVGHERALRARRARCPARPSRAHVDAARALDERADRGVAARRHPAGPVEDARARRAREPAVQLAPASRRSAPPGGARPRRAPTARAEVEDRRAHAGQGVEPLHAVVAHAGALEQPEEVRVGVLGDDHQVGASATSRSMSALGNRNTDGGTRPTMFDVPASSAKRVTRHQRSGGQDLDQHLVGGEVQRGHAARRRGPPRPHGERQRQARAGAATQRADRVM